LRCCGWRQPIIQHLQAELLRYLSDQLLCFWLLLLLA
jgi:hypothetical protein